MIEAFGADQVVFTGVAGGLALGVQVGDVVVAQQFMQHDMDVSPLFTRFEVPLYGRTLFDCDPGLSEHLWAAAHSYLESRRGHADPGQPAPGAGLHRGLIASGDVFVGRAEQSSELKAVLQLAGYLPLAVEMEGAAVAQVCFDYGVAFAAMRTVSDRADDQAHVDFAQFVQEVASQYARGILLELMRLLSK